MNYYTNKDPTYFCEFREDIFNVIKIIGSFDKVLEVGCGSGALLGRLKREGVARTTAGLDPYAHPSDDENVDLFYHDRIESVLPKLATNYRYDLIIFADILEHLEDPWTILNTICHENLAARGMVVISLPNFRNVYTLARVLTLNSFEYKSDGVLDKTHLRFFCKNDVVRLVEDAGLEIKLLTQNFKFKRAVFFRRNRLKYINYLTLNLFPFWLSDQVIAVAKKR